MFHVDKYLLKEYDQQRYNCWHFACEVWAELTGNKLNPYLPVDWFANLLDQYATDASISFSRLEQPESPCLVLLRRARVVPHVGVYYSGRILHLGEKGASYVPLHHLTALYPKVEYYK